MKLRSHLLFLALLLSVSLLASCWTGTCVTGKGAVIKRDLVVASFHGIVVQGSMDVRVSPAPSQAVEVEGQENLVGLVESEVRDGIWTIRTSECYRTDKPFIVYIRVPTLDKVIIQGSGDVLGTGTLETGSMDLTVQGSGDVDLTVKASKVEAFVQGSGTIKLGGTCDDLNAEVQGSGDVKAGNMSTANATANVNGSGDITVKVAGTLDAVISGSGDVRYKGTPAEIKKQVSGSGDIGPAKE